MSDYKNAASPEEMEGLAGEAVEAEYVGEKESEQPSECIGSEACGALAGTVFELVAMRRGEHWRLKSEESAAVGNALDAVLTKYAPQLGNIGAEASLLLVVVSVMMPRMQADREAGANQSEA